MPLSIPCDYIMAIIDQSKAAMPFIINVFPAL